MCVKAVYDTYCSGKPESIKRVNAKFVGVVFPGEHLEVQMWKKANIVYMEAQVKERGTTAIKVYIYLEESPKL